MMYVAFSRVEMQEWQKWEEELVVDPELQRLMQEVVINPQTHVDYQLGREICTFGIGCSYLITQQESH